MKVEILRTLQDLLRWRSKLDSPIYLVPTMGNLHKGHEELIKYPLHHHKKNNQKTLVSIFVNPTQFGPDEDFESYPRSIEKDISIVESAGGSAIWAPSVDDVFPDGDESHFSIQVPKKYISTMCGKTRPGHFNGVATVVMRLLTLSRPSSIILGEKDWQQYIILKELIQDFNLTVKVIGIPTIRDIDNLAFSSRNKYLTSEDKRKSILLPNILSKASKEFKSGKLKSINKIKNSLKEAGLKVEYLEIVNPNTLQSVNISSNFSLLAACVHCGKTRLIDHIFLMNRNPIVAIDGPAGAGKSTVTRAFANELGLIYLDTGAMYRAVTWLILKEGIDPNDVNKIQHIIKDMKLEIVNNSNKDSSIIINSNNVTKEIRAPYITSIVSIVSSHQIVREALTIQQKKIGVNGGIVAEGRDIGTTVFPQSDLKIFLTATITERAKRRLADLEQQGHNYQSLEDLKVEIKERDIMDMSRNISPLIKASDAIEIITDGLTIREVVERISDLFRSKIPQEIWPSPKI